MFTLLHFLTDLTVSVSASINLPVFGRNSILCYEFCFSLNDKLHSFFKLNDHEKITHEGCVWIIAVFSHFFCHFFCRLESYLLIFVCVNFPNGH